MNSALFALNSLHADLNKAKASLSAVPITRKNYLTVSHLWLMINELDRRLIRARTRVVQPLFNKPGWDIEEL